MIYANSEDADQIMDSCSFIRTFVVCLCYFWIKLLICADAYADFKLQSSSMIKFLQKANL